MSCTIRAIRAYLLVVCAVVVPAFGQVNISGSISDANVGPLASGTVYVMTSGVTVPTGQTLTVQAGAIIKASAGAQFTVNGTLDVNGTAASPVWFTALTDDSVGGDTNGNGPSAGAPGDWRGLRFNGASHASVLEFANLRYYGTGNWGGVAVYGSSLQMTDCTLSDGDAAGVDFNSTASAATLTRCDITGNGGAAILDVLLATTQGFDSVTASGNGVDAAQVSGTTIGTMSLTAANMVNGALVILSSSTVATGETLTLGPGVALKFRASGQLTVNGTLDVNGTAANPVFLTTDTDDSVGGNANGAPSSGAPGYWRGLRLNGSSGASDLEHLTIRYSGQDGWGGIAVYGSAAAIDDCRIESCAWAGIDFNGQASSMTVRNTHFEGIGTEAVKDVLLATVPGFHALTGANNLRNAISCISTTTGGSVTIVASDLLDSTIWMRNSLTVATGASLTIGPGVITKWDASGQLVCNGTLQVNGTDQAPVYVTSIDDDSVGGDTGGDGPSSGAPGLIRGVRLNSGSAGSVIEHLDVRFSGVGGWAGVALYSADVTLRDCRVRDCSGPGFDFNSQFSDVVVEDCSIENNGGDAISDILVESLSGLKDNQASGNGRDAVVVSSTTIGADSDINPWNGFEGVFLFNSSFTVPTARRLNVGPGVIIKGGLSFQFSANGELNLLGTGREPIVFTSWEDDEYGGDTNGDGPSVGNPGTQRGIRYTNFASAGRAEYVVTRFSGSGGWYGLECSSSSVSLRSIRAEHCADEGFLINAAAGNAAYNLVAFANAGIGIRMSTGSVVLHHATCTGNGGHGIQRPTSGVATAWNCISWNNGGDNFSNYGPSDLTNCNGSPTHAGSNGNINLDPLFVDASPTVGDLNLLPGSPCLNAGDLTSGANTIVDHAERSRLLDHDLSGVLFPDIGAYELGVYDLVVLDGEPVIGTTIRFGVTGPAGMSVYGVGPLDGEFFLPGFGVVTVAAMQTVEFLPFLIPTSQNLNANLPNDPSIVGVSAGLQTATFSNANPSVGNITRIYRVTFRD